jgi:hypothetical protein
MFNETSARENMPQEWNSAYICSTYKKGTKRTVTTTEV